MITDFRAFHETELPARLAAGNGAMAAKEAARLGPFAFQVDDASYTYVAVGDGIEIVAGDEQARAVVGLSARDWSLVADDLETPPGLLYAGRADSVRGNPMRFVQWEPCLRAMYHGREIFDPDMIDLRDRDGGPLDPTRAFRLGDDPEEMAHFLRTAGYLLVRSVFAPEEVDSLLVLAAARRAEAEEGDRRSWWARNTTGDPVLCRITHLGAVPGFAELPDDVRIRALVDLADTELVPVRGSEQGVSVLFKNPDIVEGLSDLPWHRDCGMGGHAAMCPTVVVSVNLVDGTPETGELRFLPGSWTRSMGFFDPDEPRAPDGVSLRVRAGDITLHYGDGMHVAPPPTGTGPFRTSVLVAFHRPDAWNHRGDEGYNDVLLDRDDGQVEHLRDVVARG